MSMTSDQKKLFASTMSQRLYEISKFWSDCYESYHEPKDFISSLNGLIQSLRNITFIIQSNQDLVPNFDSWYVIKQNEMRGDSMLKWVHDSRNTIVKQSNLVIKSKIVSELVNWESHPLQAIIENPFTNDLEIKNTVLTLIPRKELVKKMRDPLIRIERSWVSDNLPEEELLALTAYCYRYLKKMVGDVCTMMGVSIDGSVSEKNGEILTDYNSFENSRVYVMNLKELKHYSMKSITVKANDIELKTEVKKRYGKFPNKRSDFNNDFLGELDFATDMAKRILSNDGHHVPMAFLWYENRPSEILAMVIRNTSEKYYAIRKLGDMVKEKRADGIILITESWIKTPDFRTTTGECLVISVVKHDYLELREIFYSRADSDLVFDREVVLKTIKDCAFLQPLIDALGYAEE